MNIHVRSSQPLLLYRIKIMKDYTEWFSLLASNLQKQTINNNK